MAALTRIIWHWTGGGYHATAVDREHYHFMVDGDGVTQTGDNTPEDNLSTIDDDYAAHVANLNTGSIGVAVCGMLDAQERPFNLGPCPMTTEQIAALIQITALLCRKYDIGVTRQTVLSHAEVQPTLGVKQAGKWDITWIPGMNGVGDPITVGNELRKRLTAVLASGGAPTPEKPDAAQGPLEARVAALEAWVRSFTQ